ncbi:hypothetical protein HDF19_19875 [Mucilaginibacter sp. E4BP6]|jgi:hypothetical protein|uniref:hypothetical protein n=1 Tax=Mucilaginibacter sp. E4BP6 TaxID=2723089 RepID=UPI0015CA6F82|nr:hypothetical protein [Mucilaginibacter sp. E4BP6]NYE67252.1 hypothetical protein [Mucilaginibacter sp. E4BP6]
MEWPNQEEIPKSYSTGNVSIGVDFGSLKDKGKILFVNPECSVIGVEDTPYMLFTTPKFDEIDLPPTVKDKIHEGKSLVFQPSFISKVLKNSEHSLIPEWIADFTKVEFLRFQRVNVGDLSILKDLPVQHLMLEDIKLSDSDNLIIAISQFKHLKKVSYDESLPLEVKEAIEKLNLKLTLVTAGVKG